MSQSLLTAAKWRRTGDLSSELFSISGRSEVLQLMLKQHGSHGIGMQMSNMGSPWFLSIRGHEDPRIGWDKFFCGTPAVELWQQPGFHIYIYITLYNNSIDFPVNNLKSAKNSELILFTCAIFVQQVLWTATSLNAMERSENLSCNSSFLQKQRALGGSPSTSRRPKPVKQTSVTW